MLKSVSRFYFTPYSKFSLFFNDSPQFGPFLWLIELKAWSETQFWTTTTGLARNGSWEYKQE